MIVRSVRYLVLIVALLLPTLAAAEPISVGTWSPAGPADNNSLPFWDGASWDCYACGVGHLLAPYGPLEYLNNGTGNAVAFAFTDPVISWTLLFNQTAWLGGVLRYRDGVFTYDSLTGHVSNSWSMPGQYVLFRQTAPDLTRYFLGVEDILLSAAQNDRDYNDFVVSFTLPTTRSVPEPSTLLLMGTALAGMAARRLRKKGVRAS